MNIENMRTSILTNLVLEFVLVCIIIFYWTVISPHEGCVEIFSGHDGTGAFIGCFGLLWGIGAFVRLSTGWGTWGLSLIIASCLVAFGYGLDSYGFFYAICILGAWFLLLGYVAGGIVPEIAIIFFVLGVILLLIGYPLRSFSTPTNPEKRQKATLVCPVSNIKLCNVFIVQHNKEYTKQS